MLITDSHTTILDAADIFAAQYSPDEPRKVGEVVKVPSAANNGPAIDFRLAGGVRWYSIREKWDKSGWLVTLQ